MRALLASWCFVVGCSAPPRAATSGSARPRLVVLIVVDQLPSWAFERDRSLFTGGLARLVRDGAVVSAGQIPYANPFTAPGHASISTGTSPNVHGVIGNGWYRRAEGREREAEYDLGAPAFSVGPSQGGELSPDDGASAHALRVDGIADALRAGSPGSRSIAIGLKPRAAAFMIGRKPDLAVWYEAAAGGMTTTRAYTPTVPAWLVALAKAKPVSRFFDVTWDARDPAALARVTGIADDAPGEGKVHGLDAAFPHALSVSDAPARAFLHTPYGDEIVFDTAEAALDALALGRDGQPDLLALGFNARDYAGHLWGPDSWEALDLTLRLDERLGRFFELLDARVGRGAWAVVLTSDHGATRVVERTTTPGARRIRTAEITDVVEAKLTERLGKGRWVAAMTAGNVYLVPAFLAQPAAARDAALDAAAQALRMITNVAAAGRVDRACTERGELSHAVCLSTFPAESGELYVVPVAGSLISDYKTGTHHDAPFADNRNVPIVVMGPGISPREGKGTLLQVAPTVTSLLGVPAPRATSERPLFDLP